MNWLLRFIKFRADRGFAFTIWLRVPGRGMVKIGVPVGMTVGELEDHLYNKYPGWSIEKQKEQE